MNDEQQQPVNKAEIDELSILKERADLLGIKYHYKESVDRLRTKINNKLNETAETNKLTQGSYLTKEQYDELMFKERKNNAGKLIRVRVTCMNPNKKEWDGEIISVGSAKIGTYKKFIKFNTEDGWHIPNIIYEYLKEKKCSVFYTTVDQLGQKVRKSKLVNEFSIEVLPPLTKEELKDLAVKQALAEGQTE